MTNKINNGFQFWCPIEKAKDTLDPNTGERIMRLGGIASTSDEDSDGEFLDPKGFDINPLINSGLVNWHHQTNGQPGTIIGEPSKAEIRKEGLYIETDLYPSSKIANEVWELATTLENDSTTRRLGYSIEGKVVQRKSSDKTSPDYKKIIKAIITGVAVTHQPKNAQTFANIIKGEMDDDFSEEEEETSEKSLDTNNGSALKKESLDSKEKKQFLSKSEVIEKLFKDIPAISIEKAERIHKMLINFAKMKGKKNVTDDDIQKAYEVLGLGVEENDVQKSRDEDDVTKGDEGVGGDDVKKADAEPDDTTIEKKKPVKKEGSDGEEDDKEKEVVKKAEDGGRFDRIEKAIASSHQINSKYMKAIGVMIKDASQKLGAAAVRENELLDIVKAQDDTISVLSEKVEMFGSEVPAPKALSSARPVERHFSKSDDNEFTPNTSKTVNKNQVSMSRQRAVVSEILDEATFAKGYDDEFSKAMTHFEATKSLPSDIIARLKNERGIEIVK